VFTNPSRGQVGRWAEAGWHSASENLISVFIGVIPFWYFWFLYSDIRASGSFFGACTNVFPSGKAEIAVKTRQIFSSHTAWCKSCSTVLAFGASKQAI
jgi:hypothetical protein